MIADEAKSNLDVGQDWIFTKKSSDSVSRSNLNLFEANSNSIGNENYFQKEIFSDPLTTSTKSLDGHYVLTKNLSLSKLDKFHSKDSIDFNISDSNLSKINLTMPNLSNRKSNLTAETLHILSSINIETLSFNSRFDLLFNDLSMLKASAVQDCIPIDKSCWLSSFNNNRNKYEKIKEELCCDPHKFTNRYGNDGPFNENLNNFILKSELNYRENNCTIENLDHPLSQNNKCLEQIFSHNELKYIINQDVNRINQHNEYFTHQSTKDLIANLLFIYVQHSNTDYRQGMHEILACIIYVLHEEYTKLTNSNESNEIIREIANLKYLESDCFILFQAIMLRIQDWFGTNTPKSNILSSTPIAENISKPNSQVKRNSLTLNPILFKENEEIHESVIINKINYISNVVLKNNDIEVFNHLQKVDVSLHPFGIRWLRLLFLRELEFPACLVLWDAIFATDNQEFCLVNYLFVALLSSLRDEILKMDNSNCMRLLMQPHFYLDSLDVLKTALYLNNPAIYARPTSMENSFEILNHSNFKSGLPRNVTKTNYSDNKDRNNNNSNNKSNSQLNNQQNKIKHKNSINDVDMVKIAKRLEQDYLPNGPHSHTNKKNNIKNYEMRLISMQHISYNVDLVTFTYIKKITELQNENQSLKTKLEDLEELCTLCSTKMNANIALLQDEVMKSVNIKEDDLILLAIAGLKQVRDQLNPSFRLKEDNTMLNPKNVSEINKIRYGKFQNHQLTQTSFEANSLSESTSDLTNGNDINSLSSILNANKSSLKRRLSFLFKSNNEQNSIEQNKIPSEENSVNQLIQNRIRSLSNPSNFLPSSFSFNNSTKLDDKVLTTDNEITNLDDDDHVAMNLSNMKLVLNEDQTNKVKL